MYKEFGTRLAAGKSGLNGSRNLKYINKKKLKNAVSLVIQKFSANYF